MSITHSVLIDFLDSNKTVAEYTNEKELPFPLFKELLCAFLISNYRNDILLIETEFSEKKPCHKKQSLEDRVKEILEKNRILLEST